MNQYSELLRYIKSLGESDPFVNTVIQGKISEAFLNKTEIYPILIIERLGFVFTNGQHTSVYPADSTSKAGRALSDFVDDVGVPDTIRCDLASVFAGEHTESKKEIRRIKSKLTFAEAGRHNQNHRAELEIRELKRRWRKKMIDKCVRKRKRI